MKRLLLSFLVIVGCDTTPPVHHLADVSYPACVDCARTPYVIDSVHFATSSSEFDDLGCDLDGDGRIDNELGHAMNAWTIGIENLDFNVGAIDSFAAGEMASVLEVASSDTEAGVRSWLGHHEGDTVVVGGPGLGMGGTLAGSEADFGPGSAYLELPMPDGFPPLRLLLRHARVRGTVTADGITHGVICGGIPQSQVITIIVPAIADFLSARVKRGDQGVVSLFDTDHSCAGDPACVPNAPGICRCISVDEVRKNSIMISMLASDLDFEPGIDNAWAPDASDPVHPNDSLSIAIGFTASRKPVTEN